MKTDTIAAIATAMSPSGIGIVRISGEEAFSILDQIYRSNTKQNKRLSECETHTIHYGFIYDGEELIDEVWQFIAPKILNDNEGKSCFNGICADKISEAKNLRIYEVKNILPDILVKSVL